MKQFIERLGRTDYNALTDVYTFIIEDMYEIIYKDEQGSWAETTLELIEKIEMTSDHLQRDYKSVISLANFNSAKKEIEEVYKVTKWS